ncbi:CAP domain-containing protein [Kurthia sibirica]|uniref:Serine protease n=1 Tax=Kurthia sibirica TaxID=202750 RepID=A0A2U3APL1_9BACL|nr:CAP domain-containing protein [Kurthia sibirica]PWI26488.1 hypothetical protein DEX24_03925 [Kurthia sibirica]GEK33057.1 secretion protein [Kurthia sibirica]
MKKLFAWVLFFVIILGSYQFIRYTLSQPVVKETVETVKRNVDDKLENIEKKEQQKDKNIVLKDTTTKQIARFKNEYATSWAMTHTAYQAFTLQMPNNSGGYIAGEGRKLFATTIGKTTYEGIKKIHGEPIVDIVKGNTKYLTNNDKKKEMLLYELEGYYVTFFVDVHNANKLRAIQYIKKDVEQSKPGFYGVSSNDLRRGFEQLMIELMNQARVEHQLKPLKYDKGLTAQARAHSQEMVDHRYFAHEGLNGSTPESRMKAAGYVQENYYAENLAYGQYSAIFAHEGLMNSLGHRENILNKNLTNVGVGVAFDRENKPYFTINFYTPF